MSQESVFGKYELVSKIASGGMGEIFMARRLDTPSAPPVALKRILPHFADDPRFVRFFFHEATIQASLDHPNLVKILDFGKEQGTFFMAMELVDGLGVDMLAMTKRLSLPAAVEIVRQALTGIHYAHTRCDAEGKPLGIVHLDLSPHNLMLTRDGVVKIIDFGIAKAAYDADQKSHNALVGTYAYMSPEQAQEKPVDARSDVFTLGIVLYELSTGRPLFSAQSTPYLTLKAITDGQVPPPSNHAKDYPAPLEALLYRALEVDPDKRLPSAQAFLDELTRIVTELGLPHGAEMLETLLGGQTPLPTLLAPPDTAGPATPPPVESAPAPRVEPPAPEKPAPAPTPSPAPASPREREAAEAWRLWKRRRLAIWAVAIGLAALIGVSVFGLQRARQLGLPEKAEGVSVIAKQGRVLVESDPAGASVQLDGRPQDGKTPLMLTGLSLDAEHSIAVTLNGFAPEERRLTLSAKVAQDGLFLRLSPQKQP